VKIEVKYLWRTRRKTATGRDSWSTTRFPATEEFIRKEHPDAVAVEGSRQERLVLDQPCEFELHRGHLGGRDEFRALMLTPPLPGYGARQETKLLRRVSEHLIRQEGARWIVTLASTGTLMYDGAGPVEIVARVPFDPGPPTPRNPTLLRIKSRGERVLPLPPDHYEVHEHGTLATVYVLETNEMIYQGPGPAVIVQSRAPF